jgi:hypothetical protein
MILAEIPANLWEQIAGAGVPALLMAIAVAWLQKSNRELVMELNRERSERIDGLEKHVEDCDTDRKELRNLLLRHLGQSE